MNGLADRVVEDEGRFVSSGGIIIEITYEEKIKMLNIIEEVINLPDKEFNAFVHILKSKSDKGELVGEALSRERKI